MTPTKEQFEANALRTWKTINGEFSLPIECDEASYFMVKIACSPRPQMGYVYKNGCLSLTGQDRVFPPQHENPSLFSMIEDVVESSITEFHWLSNPLNLPEWKPKPEIPPPCEIYRFQYLRERKWHSATVEIKEGFVQLTEGFSCCNYPSKDEFWEHLSNRHGVTDFRFIDETPTELGPWPGGNNND